jgi:hypothetical protein
MLFFHGAIATTALVAGLFFIRFWRASRDSLFLYFAVAFWLFAAQSVATAALQNPPETRHYLYLLRLAGFALIIVGIIHKNRRERG